MKFILAAALTLTLFAGIIACSKDDANPDRLYCSDLITDTVGKNDPARIFIPNAFTPNGDGINDAFTIFAVQVAALKLTIYDDQNAIVFSTEELGASWSPSTIAAGNKTYFFAVQATTSQNNKIGVCGELFSVSCIPMGSSGNYNLFDELTPFGFTGVSQDKIPLCP